jgi:hypothetical protein
LICEFSAGSNVNELAGANYRGSRWGWCGRGRVPLRGGVSGEAQESRENPAGALQHWGSFRLPRSRSKRVADERGSILLKQKRNTLRSCKKQGSA